MTISAGTSTLAPRLLAWFETHGRKDLPWQQDATPYRVWVSEIMLQQTQVVTVIPYFRRFMSSFPALSDLAAAPLDEVMHLWTGLGYYARARNLHRAARIVAEHHGGRLPEDIDTLQSLPGIGRSTAGAILALSRSRRHPILEGNARRVIARYFGVEGHPGQPQTLARLWELADACTPAQDVARYTQAVMDLGSMVCTRKRPACDACPLARECSAFASGSQHAIPAPRPRRARPHREATALVLVRPDGLVLLQDRPAEGLWGGLWSLPIFQTPNDALDWCAAHLRTIAGPSALPDYAHAFTHFELMLRPVLMRVEAPAETPEGHRWYDPGHPDRIGLTKPTLDLLKHVANAPGQ